jgi:hypothetical protein
MAWTYSATPGTSTADERRDSVRLLVGDTDTNDQQLQDAEIAFFLAQTNDAIYAAAAQAARTLAAKYARLVDTSVESVRVQYSKRREQYDAIAVQMERLDKKFGAGLGTPLAGGISISEMDSADDDSDRPRPRFERGMFNAPGDADDGRDVDSWWEYHR